MESSRARKHERVKELVSLSKSRAHFLAFCVWSFFSFKQVVGRTGTKEGRKAGRKAGRREGRKEGRKEKEIEMKRRPFSDHVSVLFSPPSAEPR